METLKDYNDYLLEHGYELAKGSHEYLNGFLISVIYKKKDFKHYVRLYVEETDKFHEFLETLKEGDEYEIKNENKHYYFTLINLWMSWNEENWDNSEINPENIPERFRQDYENYRNRIPRPKFNY